MSDITSILRVLADGETHSGEELSEFLGVSRTAVWKQLKRLQESTGLQIESIRGKGYRLAGGLELLDSSQVVRQLSLDAKSHLTDFILLGQVDSTNTIALNSIQEGGSSGYVVVAEQQSAGRGRRGRQWVSPYGCNIYCSAVWQFQSGAAALEGLSLAVGLAVARALGQVGVERVELKWPNDVLCQGRKLAGILLEMVGDAAGHCHVVVGIGINVSMSQAAGNWGIDQPWIDATTASGASVSRNRLLSRLLSELLPLLSEFERKGFSAFRQAWSELDAMFGKDVCLHMGGQTVFGRAAGVGESGALAIDTAAGRQWFNGGEVSLRLAPEADGQS